MNKIKKYLIPAGPLTVLEWGELWLKRLQPSAKSKVLLKWNATGKKPKPKSSKEYTNRRIKEETKRTWRSDVADIAHGIGEGVLALHPYTAIPYYGAKVSLDVVNGNVGLQTALNASIPLFHLAPAPASVGTVIDNTLEDVANAGSKTVKNLRVAREVKKLVNNINPSNLETFVDEYGRTITPTPWKGTDQSLIDLIAENLVNILKDYFVSPEKIALVKKTMKWGDKEYSEFLNELMRSIGTLSNGQVKGPKDGFTIIALHSGKALGEGSNMKGIHTMTFNRERIPNKKMAVEAIMHEIGGHGKTMSINPSKPSKISESFPRLTELMKKNLELADNILLLNNRGKFWNLFPNASDLELYLYNKGIHLHPKNTEQLFDQRRYFQYMTKDAQERAARAYTGLIMDKLGYDKTLNIKLLERYYTPESVEKYKNAVLNFGVPITGGYTLYNLLNNQNTNQLLEYKKRGGKMNIIEKFKKGSGIHIKKENRGKFTDYCGGKVTSECIAKGKNSSNPAIRKRATFAANARKWKHLTGGTLVETLGGGNTITAKLKAKSNLTKRKAPDWDNLDRGYRYLTLDMKLPHDLAIAIMGNVVEESQGDYKAALKNGRGRGLIQWDGRPAPKGRYGQWGSIWASVAKPANVYDKATDTVKNYWGPYNGLKGEQVRLEFIKAPLKKKVEIYSNSYLRAGNPRNEARYLSAMQLDSIYNPRIKNTIVRKHGGLLRFLQEGGKNGSPSSSFWKKAGDFLKSDTGKGLVDLGKGLFSGISNYKLDSKNIDEAVELVGASAEEQYINALQQAEMQRKQALLLKDFSPDYYEDVLINNDSAAVKSHVGWEDYSRTVSEAYNKKLLALKMAEQQAREAKSNALGGMFGSFVLNGLGVLGNIIGSKKTPTTTSTSGLSNNNTVYTSSATGISDSVDNWKKAIQG